MKGIDISAWQENIDWQAVVDAGIEFVIVKLGQSGNLDSMFIEHINNAVANGLKVGVYYYSTATCVEEAEVEADFVDEQIKEYLNGKCPEMGIWYDVEDPCMEGSDITAICNVFLNDLEEYENVGIYSSYNWLTNGNIDTSNINAPIWVAQYNYECNFDNAKIWQYTDHFSDDLPYDGDVYYD